MIIPSRRNCIYVRRKKFAEVTIGSTLLRVCLGEPLSGREMGGDITRLQRVTIHVASDCNVDIDIMKKMSRGHSKLRC